MTITLAASTVDLTPSTVNKVLIPTFSQPEATATDSFTTKIAIANLPKPEPFTVTAVTVNGSPILTTSADFNRLRKNDALSGTGIPKGTTVAEILHADGSNTQSLTLSANATAGDGTKPVEITVTPPTPTGELFLIEGALKPVAAASGGKEIIELTVDVYVLDGKTDATKAGSITARQNFVQFEANIARK